MPFKKMPKERLVNAAMHPSATRKFLRKFHEYGKKNGWFPELPKDIKEEELGRWMRKNTTLSDKELVEKMREWVHDYTSVKIISEEFPELNKICELLTQMLTTPPRKTLSAFLQTHHADCMAMSTALGEMAREMGFDVEYRVVDREGIDTTKLTEEEKRRIERQGDNHAYVVINGEQHDPSLNFSYTNHEEKPQTREERAAMIWTNHGAILSLMGKHEKALTAHDIALEINPNDALAWNNKGVTLHEIGRYEEALEYFDKALKIEPKFAKALIGKGIVLSKMGRYKKAIKHFDKALKINPRYAEAWAKKGATLCMMGRYKKAIKHFDKALKINPNNAEAWYNKGIALSKMGRHEEALKTVEEALKRIPEGHPLRNNIEYARDEIKKRTKSSPKIGKVKKQKKRGSFLKRLSNYFNMR
ncbi:MAG: tetratricopeptide repeat protein [Candidatus Diapherotrites archaeon]|nr:tetratricopeptide repeat protein [Candidatus Diapherotrites archaeon]